MCIKTKTLNKIHFELVEYKIINEYEHPCSLYTFMGGTIFRGNMDEIGYQTITSVDILKRKMTSKGVSIRGRNTNEALQFIVDNPLKIFTAKEFIEYCNIKNRGTSRDYLKRFIKCGFIIEISKGIYENRFNLDKYL